MSDRYNAWAFDGHYIMGKIVARCVTLEEGLAAISAEIRKGTKGKYTQELRTYKATQAGDYARTDDRYLPPGSLMVDDRSPVPGPYPVGALQAVGPLPAGAQSVSPCGLPTAWPDPPAGALAKAPPPPPKKAPPPPPVKR